VNRVPQAGGIDLQIGGGGGHGVIPKNQAMRASDQFPSGLFQALYFQALYFNDAPAASRQ
jgi:hypothetical protein